MSHHTKDCECFSLQIFAANILQHFVEEGFKELGVLFIS